MKLYATVFLLALLAGLAPVFAQTVSITVNNVDNQDLSPVSVFDLNQQGQVVFNRRLNQGDSASIPVTADGNGNGSIQWRVTTTTTPPSTTCNTASGLGDGAQVNVSSGLAAGSPC